MKVIIAGGRDFTNYALVEDAIKCSAFEITQVVSGKAKGVDTLGEVWALANNIPVEAFPADWSQHGRAAGPIRNREMAEYADALIAIWDGESKGTANMIQQARNKRLNVFIYLVKESNDGKSTNH
jgi:hypothetical protein